MNVPTLLRTIYAPLIHNLRIGVFNCFWAILRQGGRWLDPEQESEVFVSAAMTVLCMVATAFYVRFLVALFKECPPRVTGYWVRLRLGSGEDTLAEVQERRKPLPRAA